MDWRDGSVSKPATPPSAASTAPAHSVSPRTALIVSIATAVAYAGTLAANGTAGSKNGAISDAYRTAFTPAGYAFSIWGLIYFLGALYSIFQLMPSRRAWAFPHNVLFLCNYAGNTLWTFAFTGEWGGGLWPSTVIIFVGVMAPLAALHVRMGIGGHSGAARATFSELLFAHAFVSLYLGWLVVACVANVSLSLTPRGGPAPSLGGLSPSGWSIIMQCVATALALLVLALRRDVVLVAPIAWALFAIGKQQGSAGIYPGDDSVVLAARSLGSIVVVAGAAVAGLRIYTWISGGSAFAPSRLTCCGRRVVVASLGLVGEQQRDEAALAASGDAEAAFSTTCCCDDAAMEAPPSQPLVPAPAPTGAAAQEGDERAKLNPLQQATEAHLAEGVR